MTLSMRIAAAAFSCLLPAIGQAADKPASAETKKDAAQTSGRIAWGTKSEAARTAVAEALQRQDGLAPGSRVRDAAQKAVDADPSSAIAHYLLGATFGGDAAKPHLEKAAALALEAPDGEKRYVESALKQRARQSDAAVGGFQKLGSDYPGEPLVRISLGQLYTDAGNLGPARVALEEAVALRPTSARALSALGNTLMLAGEYKLARERFEAAAKNLAAGAPTTGLRNGIARSYLYEGNSEAAVKTVQQAIEEYKQVPAGFPEAGLWNAMARIQLESGHPEASLESYVKGFESVKAAPSMSEEERQVWLGRMHHGRARSLARKGEHKEAWAEAEIVKKMIEDGGDAGKQYLPAYHYLAGYLKLEAGEAQAALEHLKLAEPEDDDFRKLLLARAYEKLGDKESARKAYQEIVDSKDNNLERALAYPEAKKKLL